MTRQETETNIQRRSDTVDISEKYPLNETTFLVSGANTFNADISKMLKTLHYENIITDSWR